MLYIFKPIQFIYSYHHNNPNYIFYQMSILFILYHQLNHYQYQVNNLNHLTLHSNDLFI